MCNKQFLIFSIQLNKNQKLRNLEQKLMTKSMACPECGLKMIQIQEIYENRLNSLADTFLTLVNNIENDSLFRDLEKVQIIENRKDFEIRQYKQKIYSFRMEFLQSVLEGVIHQNQQSTIKNLQIQNASLKSQNTYFQKIIQYNQLSYRNVQSQFFDQHQNINGEPFCKSEFQEQLNSEKNRNTFLETKQKFARRTRNNDLMKKINRKKLSLKFSTEDIECSSQSVKDILTPQSTSFVVNLKENGSDLSNNCISSIDPVSQASSFPSSQKSFIKGKNQPKSNPKNQIFTVSLRQQLSSLNSDSKRVDNLPYSESRRKRPEKRIIEYEQNEENVEPGEYQFKYLKL